MDLIKRTLQCKRSYIIILNLVSRVGKGISSTSPRDFRGRKSWEESDSRVYRFFRKSPNPSFFFLNLEQRRSQVSELPPSLLRVVLITVPIYTGPMRLRPVLGSSQDHFTDGFPSGVSSIRRRSRTTKVNVFDVLDRLQNKVSYHTFGGRSVLYRSLVIDYFTVQENLRSKFSEIIGILTLHCSFFTSIQYLDQTSSDYHQLKLS